MPVLTVAMAAAPLVKAGAAGVAAAALAYGMNWFVLRRLGRRGLWLAVPALEECLKTGAAAAMQAPVFLAHVFFGVVEAVSELRSARRPTVAAALALSTHAAFGLITVVLLRARDGIPGPAVLAAATAHALFNLAVTGDRRSVTSGSR